MERTTYPSDVSDEEWAFVAPYLTLMRTDAPQREHDLREVFNGLRWVLRTGSQWRMMPHDLPPWYTVYQQSQRWIQAEVFEQMVDDLRGLLRLAEGRAAPPSAVVIDSRTVQSTPESGNQAGFDGAKQRRGRKVHLAVDTLGYLLAAYVTPANQQDRAQVAELAERVQWVTGGHVQVAFADEGYSGESALADAASQGIQLILVKRPTDKRGFILLPKRWVVERSIAWLARFRRLARDYERLPKTLAGLHFVAFAVLLLARFAHSLAFVL